MQENLFNLGRFDLKHCDGTGKVISCSQTPASVVRATEEGFTGQTMQALASAYYSLEAAGLLKDLGVSFEGCETERDRILRLFDTYSPRFLLLDDNGNELSDGTVGDSDPTGARRRASRS